MTKIISYKMVQRVYSQNEDTAQKDVSLECFSLAVLTKMDLNCCFLVKSVLLVLSASSFAQTLVCL